MILIWHLVVCLYLKRFSPKPEPRNCVKVWQNNTFTQFLVVRLSENCFSKDHVEAIAKMDLEIQTSIQKFKQRGKIAYLIQGQIEI